MSYEIVKRLRIDNGSVLITADSNNVYPKIFKERKCTYLTDLLQQEGEEALNLYILQMYEQGIFQEGNPNKWSRAIQRLSNTEEYKRYSWRLSDYSNPNCPINTARENKTEYNKLLLSALNMKPTQEKYIIRNNSRMNEVYVLRVTKRFIKYTSDKSKIKKFTYKEEADSVARLFNFLEVIEIDKSGNVTEKIPTGKEQLILF